MFTKQTADGAKRAPWRAAFLGLLAPGLGHLYCGLPLRGAIVHVAQWAMVMLLIWGVFLLRSPLNVLAVVGGGVSLWVFILGDGVRCARASGEIYQLKAYNRWYVYLALFLLATVEQGSLMGVMRTHVAAFSFPSGSMLLTVLSGDHFLVDKRAYASKELQRGDLVVFISPKDRSKLFLKRVMGLPGEQIEIRNKRVVVNGAEISNPYAYFSDETQLVGRRDTMAAFTLPTHAYFVLSDNRNASNDSRFWGPVARQDILGRARMIYFSWDAQHHRVRWERIGKVLE